MVVSMRTPAGSGPHLANIRCSLLRLWSATTFAMAYDPVVSACLVEVPTAGSRPYLYIAAVVTRNGPAIPQS